MFLLITNYVKNNVSTKVLYIFLKTVFSQAWNTFNT